MASKNPGQSRASDLSGGLRWHQKVKYLLKDRTVLVVVEWKVIFIGVFLYEVFVLGMILEEIGSEFHHHRELPVELPSHRNLQASRGRLTTL